MTRPFFPPLSVRTSREAFEDRAGEEINAAADRETLAAWDVDRARLAAADALAEKADQLLECIRMGWAHGDESIALDDAVREYREVSK